MGDKKIKSNKSMALSFIPLGGLEQVGGNCALYGFGDLHAPDKDWIMVDCGIAFAQQKLGYDVLVPKLDALKNRKLKGVFVTHGHEDHIGAIMYVWNELDCPVYVSPFAKQVLINKLKSVNIMDHKRIKVIDNDSSVKIGQMDIMLHKVAHSTLESHALIIKTPLGTVVHSGDWKIDQTPVEGDKTDLEALSKLAGADGVEVLVCDSTNVFKDGHSGSESLVRDELALAVSKCKTGQVFVTCFASNISRISSIFNAATKSGRSVYVVGHAINTFIDISKSVGYLENIGSYTTLRASSNEDFSDVPPEKRLFICTGSQGESRAALTRIVMGEHKSVSLQEGDSVIFSSAVIPTNEQPIFDVYNQIVLRGARVVVSGRTTLHVSGHPCREELISIYDTLKPKTLVPVHGEQRHLKEQELLAKSYGIKNVLVPRNGDACVLLEEGAQARILSKVPVVGYRAVLGEKSHFYLIPEGSHMFEQRLQMSQGGVICIVMMLKKGRPTQVHVDFIGVIDLDKEKANLLAMFKKAYENVRELTEDGLASMMRKVLRSKKLMQAHVQVKLINV